MYLCIPENIKQPKEALHVQRQWVNYTKTWKGFDNFIYCRVIFRSGQLWKCKGSMQSAQVRVAQHKLGSAGSWINLQVAY